MRVHGHCAVLVHTGWWRHRDKGHANHAEQGIQRISDQSSRQWYCRELHGELVEGRTTGVADRRCVTDSTNKWSDSWFEDYWQLQSVHSKALATWHDSANIA